jgi:hypothetical protein
MRSLAIVAVLAGMLPGYAAAQVVTATFSGTFPAAYSSAIHAGDTFSGSATWKASTTAASVNLQSASLTLPAADGLSFTSIPSANVVGAAAVYTNGVLYYVQFNVRSTADGNIYVFLAAPTAGSVTNAGFSSVVAATNFTFKGPTPVAPAAAPGKP